MEINVVFAVAVEGAIVSAIAAIGVVSARRVAIKKKTAMKIKIASTYFKYFVYLEENAKINNV